jgi:hypothetical protein
MGRELAVMAGYARDRHPDMTDRALIVLTYMALRASDNDTRRGPRCRYMAGWPYLQARVLPKTPDSEAARKAVNRAVRELVGYGLVSVETPGAPGRSAVYRLHLEPWPTG